MTGPADDAPLPREGALAGAATDVARALRFYSRLPVPALPWEADPHALPDFARMARMLPVAGAILGAIGAAGIPGSGLIMMVLVFGAVGVPLETIALVAGIDRIMDMMRTTTNVTGDAAVAVTVASMTGELDRAELISADDV